MEKTATQWMVEPLRKYATFSGRARRAEYWWFVLFGILLGVAAGVIDLAIGSGRQGPVTTIVSLGLLLPQLAVSVRRLHDLNRSGWWLLLSIASGAVAAFFAISVFATVLFNDSASPTAAALAGGSVIGLAISGLVAFAFEILLLVWFCTRGTSGENRFGPDPAGGEIG